MIACRVPAFLLVMGLAMGSGSAEVSPWNPFAPLRRADPPVSPDPAWDQSPIDRFLHARLCAAGLSPAPETDRRVWLRRVTFDLTGLPPAPEEVREFREDGRSDAEARERVVDRLLASPRYGERWARHWLDVVRYADTDGFAIDGERPTLWRYRDYVIRALNEDRFFDRFIREQIAGDEIESGPEGAVALGFYRLGPFEADNMVAAEARQDYLNEITSAVGSVFLGLTFGCARCHDHKYDPIPTRDYYRVQAFLSSVERADREAALGQAELRPHVEREKAVADLEARRRSDELAAHRAAMKTKLASALGKEAAQVTDADLDAAIKKPDGVAGEDKKRLVALKQSAEEFTGARKFAAVACAISTRANDRQPTPCRVLASGSVSSPGEEVHPGFPGAIGAEPEVLSRLESLRGTAAGRRRALAEWLSSPANALVWRVLVNRIWQNHFDVGIVATPNDFGKNGRGASHPELLDHLARELIKGGFRLKPLHRAIVLSRAYRSSSRHCDPAAPTAIDTETRDPENRLLWRFHVRRLEAEEIRDAVLAASGQLSLVEGGPGFFEEIPAELGRDFPFFRWEPSSEAERRRRSIYLFHRRNMIVPFIESFDGPELSASCEARRTSVTAPQALSLLHGKFAVDQSRRFAERIVAESGPEPARQVERVFALAFAREPVESEVAEAEALLADQAATLRAQANAEGEARSEEECRLLALKNLCLVAINANEFIYLE